MVLVVFRINGPFTQDREWRICGNQFAVLGCAFSVAPNSGCAVLLPCIVIAVEHNRLLGQRVEFFHGGDRAPHLGKRSVYCEIDKGCCHSAIADRWSEVHPATDVVVPGSVLRPSSADRLNKCFAFGAHAPPSSAAVLMQSRQSAVSLHSSSSWVARMLKVSVLTWCSSL